MKVRRAPFRILMGIVLTLVGLGFAAMPTNPSFSVPNWVPILFFVLAFLVSVWLVILLIIGKGIKKPPQLSNRKELISAIHQVKEMASNVILTSAVLGEVHKVGKKPPQQFVVGFSNAFDKYQEALKSLEREALIAGEAFHNSINSFSAKITSCVQTPAPPISQPGSTVVCLDNPENANKLNAAMNEVVKEIDEINQPTPDTEGSQP